MKRIFSIILIITFLFIISFPNGDLFVLNRFSPAISDNENRVLNPFPALSGVGLQDWPPRIIKFYNDNFGFREQLIELAINIRWSLLGSNDAGSLQIVRIIWGKNGWQFADPDSRLKPTDPRTAYKEFYSTILFTQPELETIKRKMEADDVFFKYLSIPYYNIIVPDKEVIYSEFFYYPNHIITNLRLDQLNEYLNKNSSSKVTFLKDLLLSEKKEKLLYIDTDPHWTDYGAFFAYQDIMRRLSLVHPEVYVPKLSDFGIKEINDRPDSGLVTLVPKPELLKIQKLKSVFIYGDSFTGETQPKLVSGFSDSDHMLVRFLTLSFEQVYVQKQDHPIEYEKIKQEKPDLVIKENIQRNLRVLIDPQLSIF